MICNSIGHCCCGCVNGSPRWNSSPSGNLSTGVLLHRFHLEDAEYRLGVLSHVERTMQGALAAGKIAIPILSQLIRQFIKLEDYDDGINLFYAGLYGERHVERAREILNTLEGPLQAFFPLTFLHPFLRI